MEGSRIVSAAIVGYDSESVMVAGRHYFIKPPTIKKIAGMAYWLSNLKLDEATNIILAMKDLECAAKALSFLISGDESLSNELSNGTIQEVSDALEKGLKLIDPKNFTTLSVLTRNVSLLTARPRR